MNFKNILTKTERDILIITLNRPQQLNALNTEVFEDIEQIMDYVAQTDSIRGVIITGSGEKAFAAGADIKEFANFSSKEGQSLASNGQRIFNLIENSRKPVIAAVNGYALGGGLELAMACHLRIASVNSKFGQPEVSLGVTPGYAGTQRLTQLIGKAKSLELLMTGAIIKSDEALELRLINYVVPLNELMKRTIELIDKILNQSGVAVAGVIACVNAYYKDGIDGFEAEAEEFGKCFETGDFIEGTTAFIEKRKPNFRK